ncbi:MULTISPECIES: UbiD family decarboxylase [Rhodococcus]|uniref:UbiD family decarboxylase n=1 Tax=Rhodococcus globerulus TaxID=33008 RepID=A0ABU4BYL5_RHOGO|nr:MULTISPECIES: UbiD family decarboxylase [Rhodococcus]MDV6269299.1 UbiD family decarboxylase [Rhodococcus globerulus]MDV8066648.1 UbiD family decarboxylase [Rhodococcus sp. IEGM 1366]
MTAVGSLREQILRLTAVGALGTVDRAVSPVHELAAIAHKADLSGGPALLFRNVGKHSARVVVGTDSSRERVASALGVELSKLTERYASALTSPITPTEISVGPVHERVFIGDAVDLGELPILTHFEHDGGPYITSGIVTAVHPVTGERNLSYHRMQVKGPRELRMVIVPRHLHRIYEAYEDSNQPMPVSIILGVDAPLRFAAGTSGSAIPFGADEYGISGGLRCRPEELVRGVTNDLMVPAHAEIVIEGHVMPHLRGDEGPFAEFAGFYKGTSPRHVVHVDAVTHRTDPIYQGLLSGSMEQLLLMGLPNEPAMLTAMRGGIPEIRAINVTGGGLNKFHVVVALEKKHSGDGKDAIVAAFAAHRDVKLVVVVDHEVDPFDHVAVERAIATRFRADEDLVVISGGRGNPVDTLLTSVGTTARMGMDATAPLKGQTDLPERAMIPGASEVDLAEWLSCSTDSTSHDEDQTAVDATTRTAENTKDN